MKARVLALYLPQFHPIPENDNWWGKGFTEWTNVGKAKKLFPNQYQPRVPADLGYYDLRVSETRKAQADMARKYGVEGFLYWHYWFGNGKRLIERPFNEVLESGEPDFPFALAWANETWKGFAHGIKNRNVLIEQLYPGVDDYTAHFYEVLPAFKDKRYITVDGKPVFLIYKPLASQEVNVFIETWRKLALENGLKGIYFIAQSKQFEVDETLKMDFDAVNVNRLWDYWEKRPMIEKMIQRSKSVLFKYPSICKYKNALKGFVAEQDKQPNFIPSIYCGWDHTPRSGRDGIVYTGYNPELLDTHIKQVMECVDGKSEKLIILKSWNEWAEGNYMEPDLKFGHKYLEVLKENL